jgi:hypothetical protein
LNIVINHLIEDVSIKILGKCKLENNDSVTVDDGVELFYDVFNIFR